MRSGPAAFSGCLVAPWKLRPDFHDFQNDFQRAGWVRHSLESDCFGRGARLFDHAPTKSVSEHPKVRKMYTHAKWRFTLGLAPAEGEYSRVVDRESTVRQGVAKPPKHFVGRDGCRSMERSQVALRDIDGRKRCFPRIDEVDAACGKHQAWIDQIAAIAINVRADDSGDGKLRFLSERYEGSEDELRKTCWLLLGDAGRRCVLESLLARHGVARLSLDPVGC